MFARGKEWVLNQNQKKIFKYMTRSIAETAQRRAAITQTDREGKVDERLDVDSLTGSTDGREKEAEIHKIYS